MASTDQLVVKDGEVSVISDVVELHSLSIIGLLVCPKYRFLFILACIRQGNWSTGWSMYLLFSWLKEFTLWVLLRTHQGIKCYLLSCFLVKLRFLDILSLFEGNPLTFRNLCWRSGLHCRRSSQGCRCSRYRRYTWSYCRWSCSWSNNSG